MVCGNRRFARGLTRGFLEACDVICPCRNGSRRVITVIDQGTGRYGPIGSWRIADDQFTSGGGLFHKAKDASILHQSAQKIKGRFAELDELILGRESPLKLESGIDIGEQVSDQIWDGCFG